jgi:PAS domain S-box-containing protein
MTLNELMASPLFETAADGLLVVNDLGVVRGANEAAVDMLRIPLEALVGSSIDALLPQSFRAEHRASVAAFFHAAMARPMASGRRFTVERGDGTEMWASIALSPVSVDGERYVVAALRDVSDMVVAEARMEVVARRKMEADVRERLGRDVHDVVIQDLFAIGLSLQSGLPSANDEFLRERIERAIDDIDAVIRSLRNVLAGFTLGASRGLLGAVLEIIAKAAPRIGSVPQVVVDPTLDDIGESLHEDVLAVLNEALSNVIRHSSASEVRVEIGVRGTDFVLRVVDDGIGLDDTSVRRSGLANLRQRAEAREGGLALSATPHGGLTLEWRVPTVNCVAG